MWPEQNMMAEIEEEKVREQSPVLSGCHDEEFRRHQHVVFHRPGYESEYLQRSSELCQFTELYSSREFLFYTEEQNLLCSEVFLCIFLS